MAEERAPQDRHPDPPDTAVLADRLRPAIEEALQRLAPVRAELRAAMAVFAERHGGAVVTPRPLAVRGRSPSWEQARSHARDVAALGARLARHPVAVAVEWGAPPQAGPDDARLAPATATALARRLLRLAEIERAATRTPVQLADGVVPVPSLHPDALAVWAPYAAATGQGWGRYLARAFTASRALDPSTFAEGWQDRALEAEDDDLDAVLGAVVRELARIAGGDANRMSLHLRLRTDPPPVELPPHPTTTVR